ncbi:MULTISPECIES: hypothetical protein [Pseudomonas]|uniref:Phage protein n=1 Tax=Pseudomonas syringae TaxID=317 RepID=A0AB37ZLF9_PSESX|nr:MULTISPECIES: hypothetical protein [Pseudomonas]KTB71159.1 hypothetical protein AO068_18905 [Pseudomonas sp. ICMP 3272]KTC52971.1 hypothetical protein AO258_18820 [Pseudomonas syringae ICMP 19498]MBI6665393.1 hypothetical protein [Pseudomonas syringae]MBI6679647.1 hypothetical protein [Pseudomonas syringae]MCK9719643.1 hypothetical protein [Pseudomonas syringae pv. syringae]
MSKNELEPLIKSILVDLRNVELMRGESYLHAIIRSYENTLRDLLKDCLTENLIKSSPREYLEIYSDYENPLVEQMDFAQKQLQKYINHHI